MHCWRHGITASMLSLLLPYQFSITAVIIMIGSFEFTVLMVRLVVSVNLSKKKHTCRACRGHLSFMSPWSALIGFSLRCRLQRTSTMRRYIAPEVKEMVVKLALVHKYRYKKFKRITGVSMWSIKGLKALYLRTGEVVQKRVVDGRPCTLNGFEASVSESRSRY